MRAGGEATIRERRLYGSEESATYLNITTRTLDRLVKRGVLMPIRLPGLRRVFFDKADLDGVIAASKAERDYGCA